MTDSEQICWQGKFLQIVKKDHWEFATRNNCNGIVGIIAITPNNELILVEQHRTPVAANVIEIPAGLSGDNQKHANEPLQQAAQRELLEETGYTASKWQLLNSGTSSAGLTDEIITFFLATNLQRTSQGGGDESENITVHCVNLQQIDAWLTQQQNNGKIIDTKVFASLYWANKFSQHTG